VQFIALCVAIMSAFSVFMAASLLLSALESCFKQKNTMSTIGRANKIYTNERTRLFESWWLQIGTNLIPKNVHKTKKATKHVGDGTNHLP